MLAQERENQRRNDWLLMDLLLYWRKSGKYAVIGTFGMVYSGCNNICTCLVRLEKVYSNKRREADGFSVRDLMLRFFWDN